jgi:hypothetical protein
MHVNFLARVGTFTKKFSSSRFDASNITITFQAYFLPYLKGIDLLLYNQKPKDNYPFKIAE